MRLCAWPGKADIPCIDANGYNQNCYNLDSKLKLDFPQGRFVTLHTCSTIILVISSRKHTYIILTPYNPTFI